MLRLALALSIVASAAHAHPGHLAGLAGHDHWVAGAAIGTAIAIGILMGLKGRKKAETPEPEPELETEEA